MTGIPAIDRALEGGVGVQRAYIAVSRPVEEYIIQKLELTNRNNQVFYTVTSRLTKRKSTLQLPLRIAQELEIEVGSIVKLSSAYRGGKAYSCTTGNRFKSITEAVTRSRIPDAPKIKPNWKKEGF